MLYLNVVKTFPSVQIENSNGNLPVEVSLIAQLGHGAGDSVYQRVFALQENHPEYVDELNEPSTKLGGLDLEKNDATSLYSFLVGEDGHPFHRHAGHRIFTAISGSGGVQLRFSTVSDAELAVNPAAFVKHMHIVRIPADCLFTVRFGGQTWHQFYPLSANRKHPTFVALSAHTNELAGIVDKQMIAEIAANRASVPSLTELLPPAVEQYLANIDYNTTSVPKTDLALDAAEGTLHRIMCNVVRGSSGLSRRLFAKLRKPTGYISQSRTHHE